MAKFNIEVNLDWIEEDGTIDEVLKEEIISSVTSKIAAQTTSVINARIDALVEKTAVEAETVINEKLNTLMDDFMTRPRTITDKWGDVKKRNISIVDMLKEACDNFVDGYVDKNGNSCDRNHYGDKKKRINYIIETQIDHKMKSSVTAAADEIRKGIQKYIDETMKAQIGDGVAKIIGLDKITSKI